ncbi:unnamed protein product [Paramecium octaurelia]|uniref:Transmembrane protein n=1 Tax=Paramecium octaurelia TaxID=43137 RepID=A0A8S1VZM4_PAROT|nr:unnamed protein product [Paramecium octaurelia]
MNSCFAKTIPRLIIKKAIQTKPKVTFFSQKKQSESILTYKNKLRLNSVKMPSIVNNIILSKREHDLYLKVLIRYGISQFWKYLMQQILFLAFQLIIFPYHRCIYQKILITSLYMRRILGLQKMCLKYFSNC